MGGRLVREVFFASTLATERGEPFTANERQVLLYMASTAHDDDPEPRYWGGPEALAVSALGRRLPAAAEDAKARESILKSVSIATRGLVRRGALQLVGSAHPGRRQEYLLAVENLLPTGLVSERGVPPPGTPDSTIRNVAFH